MPRVRRLLCVGLLVGVSAAGRAAACECAEEENLDELSDYLASQSVVVLVRIDGWEAATCDEIGERCEVPIRYQHACETVLHHGALRYDEVALGTACQDLDPRRLNGPVVLQRTDDSPSPRFRPVSCISREGARRLWDRSCGDVAPRGAGCAGCAATSGSAWPSLLPLLSLGLAGWRRVRARR